MKGLFGLVGLLLALVIVGVVVKKQLDTTTQRVPALTPVVPAGAWDTPTVGVRCGPPPGPWSLTSGWRVAANKASSCNPSAPASVSTGQDLA